MSSKRFRLLLSHSICGTLIIAVFLFYPRNGFVQGGMENENQLKRHLYTSEFDPTVRPVKNSSDNVTVTVDISFTNLVDLIWHDPHFVWTPSEFGNITVFFVPSSVIWTPDMSIYNEVGMESGLDPSAYALSVKHDGTVKWFYKRTVETFCKIDAQNFPFDKQECPYIFGSWAHSGDLIDVVSKSEQGDSTFYNDNGEWILSNITTKRHVIVYKCCEQPFPDVTFTIKLKRRSLYYVYNLILPCMFITILHLAAFLLPVESGEKISLNVTILLGMTVFLLLVAEITPPQSEVIPVIGQYFGACIFLISLSTVASVLVVNLYFRGNRGHPVPRILRRVVFSKMGRILCYGNLLEKNQNKTKKEMVQRKIALSREDCMKSSGQNKLRVSEFDNDPSVFKNNRDLFLAIQVDNDAAKNLILSLDQTVLQPVRAMCQGERANGDENYTSGSDDATTLGYYDNQALSVEMSQPVEDLGVLHNPIEDKTESEQKIMREWILVSIVADRLLLFFFLLGDLAAVVYILYNICETENKI